LALLLLLLFLGCVCPGGIEGVHRLRIDWFGLEFLVICGNSEHIITPDGTREGAVELDMQCCAVLVLTVYEVWQVYKSIVKFV
jgi:hypothetical protein